MSRIFRALPCGLVLALCAAAPATAGVDASSVAILSAPALSTPTAVARTCSAHAFPAGTPGVVTRRAVVPAAGFLDARLNGSPTGPDWDLAIFDAASGRQLAASAAFGGNEVAQAPVAAGQALTIQACRYGGAGRPIGLDVQDIVVSGTLPKAPKLTSVSIAFDNAAQLDRLAQRGIDLNETAHGNRIDAILAGPADVATLRDAGMSYRVKHDDLVAFDNKILAGDRATAAAADAGGGSGLPSGRTTYRHFIDYQNDLKALVHDHPNLVRPAIMPQKSVEGRTIEGVEIASQVSRTDDGRPTHVELGIHHAREWQSGEVPMEFAIDLLQRYGKDARITSLLRNTRTFVFPVINVDGFVATMTAGDYNETTDDGSGLLTIGPELADLAAYRRKNCQDVTHTGATVPYPCAIKLGGVDLNRNYGAFWGGPGESDNYLMPSYRGPAPYSEPESQAVHEWSSAHQVMLLNSNHSYAGDVLFQPGFSRRDEPGLPQGTKVPHQDEMKAVSDDMAEVAGYKSMVSYELYDVTGATEDWNYFAQSTFGYTTEIGYDDFHVDYQDSVVDQYLGTIDGPLNKDAGRKPSQGVRESLVIAGEAAANKAYHSVIKGTAPAGRTLRLTKDFQTTTSNVETFTDVEPQIGDPILIPEHLETTLKVPATGRFNWHVNPSTRPLEILAGRTEAWTLTCEDSAGNVLDTRSVTVGLGQIAVANLACT